MRSWRREAIVAAAVAVLGLLVVGAAVMGPRLVSALLRLGEAPAGEPRVGDQAPDATLNTLDGKATVRLRDRIGGRPLILIFGSYT